MWKAVEERDWPRARTLFTEDCVFLDVPAHLTTAVKGPHDIVEKLRISLDPLAGYVHHPGLLLTNGSQAIFEHCETWTRQSGLTTTMRFVSVHNVRGGKICYWKDYWDSAG